MRVVIADTTPLRYLAEIDHLGVVPQLFQTVYISLIRRVGLTNP